MENTIDHLQRLVLSGDTERMKTGIRLWKSAPELSAALSTNDILVMFQQLIRSKELILFCLEIDFVEPIRPMTRLSFVSYALNDLPTALAKLPDLEELDLRCTGLTKVPAVIGKLKNLKKLHMGMNAIRRIPKSVFRLAKLEYLCFCQNPQLRLRANSPIGQAGSIRFLCNSAKQLSINLEMKLTELFPDLKIKVYQGDQVSSPVQAEREQYIAFSRSGNKVTGYHSDRQESFPEKFVNSRQSRGKKKTNKG